MNANVNGKVNEKVVNFSGIVGIFYTVFLLLVSGCGGGSDSPPKKTSSILAIPIPLYSYPTTHPQEYERLLSTSSGKEITVILNPSNGSGSHKDENFSQIVQKLKEKRFSVYGYIHTYYGKREINQINTEIERYNQFYPNMDGFFIDEVSNDLSTLGYYTTIYNIALSTDKKIILNPGTTVPNQFYQIADRIVIFERDLDTLMKVYKIPEKLSEKDCFLVYGVKTLQEAISTRDYLLKNGVSCLYLTDDNPPNWFKLSPYLEILIAQ